ncbi:MAG: hypothetical protein QXG98_01625 [Candidatus Micrarchaeia archaeon]
MPNAQIKKEKIEIMEIKEVGPHFWQAEKLIKMPLSTIQGFWMIMN